MKKICLLNLLSFFTLFILLGCGSSGGDDVSVGSGSASVSVTASKPLALADSGLTNDGIVTMTATVLNPDGTTAADGTTVTFAAMSTLSATSATTVNGSASVILTHDPIPGADNTITNVTATVLSVSGSTTVKFINQPSSVDVFIAFDQAVTNLAALQFILDNTAGAAFDNAILQAIEAINAAVTGSLVLGNYSAITESNEIGLINAVGFNTGTVPIIKATYDVIAGLPAFSIDQDPLNFLATDAAIPIAGPTVPVVTALNMVVTVTYDTEF
jgi:hypothetical protein